jgi:CheY-like chemotaxis protein
MPPGNTVLVVVGDPTCRHAVLRVLRHAGYDAVDAASVREAVAYLRDHPAPALILLDPSGHEFRSKRLADPALADIPIVVLSPAGQAAKAEAELLAAVARFAIPRGLGVLVVEDEPAVLQMLGLALRRYGFAVWEAGTGEEGVRLYLQHRDAIDVALLDVQMNQGMDGPQTLAALHGLDPSLPIAFMSGNTGAYAATDLVSRGAVRVFPKPFDSLEGLARSLGQFATEGRVGP